MNTAVSGPSDHRCISYRVPKRLLRHSNADGGVAVVGDLDRPVLLDPRLAVFPPSPPQQLKRKEVAFSTGADNVGDVVAVEFFGDPPRGLVFVRRIVFQKKSS